MAKFQKLFKIELYKCYNTFSEHLFKIRKNVLPIQIFKTVMFLKVTKIHLKDILRIRLNIYTSAFFKAFSKLVKPTITIDNVFLSANKNKNKNKT